MRCFIFNFLAFCLVVKADVIQVGLISSCGTTRLQDVVGPIQDNKKPDTIKRVADFTRKYGVGLQDNEEDVTNEDNFVYPCGCNQTDYDYNCIREFFANNSDCTPACGPVPDPLLLNLNMGFFPSVNITGIYLNGTIKGLSNATIYSFYYNKKTGKLIFSIEISSITSISSNNFFIYKIPGQESIVKFGASNGIYRSIILTSVISLISPFGKLRLDLAEVSSYVGEPRPDVYVDPSLTNSTNPVVIAESKSLLEMLPTIENELFLFQSQPLMVTYIQKNICDFGVKLNNFISKYD